VLLALKELAVVLILSVVGLAVARPIACRFMTVEDFSRRRSAWLLLTAAAFLSPNFWIFAIIEAIVLLFVGRRDSNPAGLYLFLLQVIPPVNVVVPMFGMSQLFVADHYLMLGLFLMLPIALRLRRQPDARLIRKFQAMDYFLLGYGLLIAFLYIHPESAYGAVYESTATDSTRRMFVYFIGIIVPYFVISRACVTRRALVDAMAAFVLSCTIMSIIAVFESARHWLLYADLGGSWGIQDKFTSYVMRGSSLRAMASAGHSLALGFLLAIGFAFWLYLARFLTSRVARISGILILWMGLIAAYSRGPWIGAVCIYFVYATFNSGGFGKLLKATAIAGCVAAVIYLSPLGVKFTKVLPVFGGTIDTQDVDYRQRLVSRTWEIVRDNPFLGDQHALLRMQDLRQGQGIIDLVNTYSGILLGNGFVGLFIFMPFILLALMKAISIAKFSREVDPDFSAMGACLGAAILGMLLMLENGSFGSGPKYMFYALAALCAAYAAVFRKEIAPLVDERVRGEVRQPR
jgi:hypothetical protein